MSTVIDELFENRLENGRLKSCQLIVAVHLDERTDTVTITCRVKTYKNRNSRIFPFKKKLKTNQKALNLEMHRLRCDLLHYYSATVESIVWQKMMLKPNQLTLSY